MAEKVELNQLREKNVQVLLDKLHKENKTLMKMDAKGSASKGGGGGSRGHGSGAEPVVAGGGGEGGGHRNASTSDIKDGSDGKDTDTFVTASDSSQSTLQENAALLDSGEPSTWSLAYRK